MLECSKSRTAAHACRGGRAASVILHPSPLVASHSLHAALQGLSLGEVLREFVAARAELEGLLHLLEHLLVAAERDGLWISLHGSPGWNQTAVRVTIYAGM